MKPSIQLYGGVHNDPGSRQKFIEELAKQKTLPHFVAVEWEESIFQRVAAWRPWLTERLRKRWNFLTRADCDDLSCALGWEGDASTTLPRFSGIERVWLDHGYQEACLTAANRLESFPKGGACILHQWFDDEGRLPPTPRSKPELVDRVWRRLWAQVKPEPWGDGWPEPVELERDARWAAAIEQRCAAVHGGWVAVAVGWQHADPGGPPQRLPGLLSSKGFSINSVCLGP